ncbi:MAG TPA: RtcB family protein [Cyanobacteria bacterium UBA11162]|nr:RtcB family protein [Cyanobacteria bacterium UBA11162]
MGDKNIERLLRALARQGLDVQYQHNTYSVRWTNQPNAPIAEVLLPEHFPVEAKALKQLANLAIASHPEGGFISRVCATPDFHPGDGGIAIGSVVEMVDQVIPTAVGSDINCGMRLHIANLSVDQFLSKRQQFVERIKGDYFFGKRDVTMTQKAMQALFQDGVIGWLDQIFNQPTGSLVRSDLNQLAKECDRIFRQGSMKGNTRWAPEELITGDFIRDGGLATIGSGNHFVEVQYVEAVKNRVLSHHWGIQSGQVAIMIHSGSRNVGKYVGGMWRDLAKAAWSKGVKYPESRLFPLSKTTHPELVKNYLEAEATAANYGFVNRLLLAELLRLRLREVYGEVEAPLIYDLPHNITLPEGRGWVTRKGACPAYEGQPVIIPGSMGTASYLLVGQGNPDFCCSASHGAGRLKSRFELSRRGAKMSEADLGLVGVDCITLRQERRIEEAPVAYKAIAPVIDTQVAAGMVQVVAKLQPILTFKA